MSLANSLLGRVWRFSLALAALAGGITNCSMGPMYGFEPPRTNPDPSLEISELIYAPANPVPVGTEVVFTATLSHPSPPDFDVTVTIGEGVTAIPEAVRNQMHASLSDHGIAPDAVPADGIYTGQCIIPLALGAQDNLPVNARVNWFSTAIPPSITGESMDTVLPEEAP